MLSLCRNISGTRRTFLKAGGAGLLGLHLDQLLQADTERKTGFARAKSIIFLFLYGGPSQLETFDLKPDAPEKIRGPFKPIPCKTPGLKISEALPRLAAISNKYCVIRTLTHSYNDHSGAGHYIQTGKRWHLPIGGGFNATPQDWPSIGSVVEFLSQKKVGIQGNPKYAVLPAWLGKLQDEGQYRRPGEYAGWLGKAYNPLTTSVEKRDPKDNPYWRDCTDEELKFELDGLARSEISLDRLQDRVSLLKNFEAQRQKMESSLAELTPANQIRERAFSLVTSEKTRQALDIRLESTAVRDRYGRGLFGQSCLMARRLIEAGTRFVTVHYDCCDGYSWDSHLHSRDVKNHLMPTFDQATAALLVDLEVRGLLQETLVVALGEMGRTPQANPEWGRNHWSTLFPALIAGAGVRGGTTYGVSDKDAAYPIDHPVSPEDLAATLYHALGIDPETRINDPQGRPVPLVDQGTPITALW
ncbi:MAG: DUF1501 domain-containing protein [Gemmataceae bacterium]|nr:DUF1501 domain-containing protein [Gemmataceae bacterium]